MSEVRFGSLPAVSFRVDSDTQLTATAPAQQAGTTVDLTVAAGSAVSRMTSADLYSYVTASWSLTGPMVNAESGATATALPGGKALLVGASAQLFNEATGTWAVASGASAVPAQHQATIDGTGDVVFTGGRSANGAAVVASVESYDPASGSWPATAAMATPRVGHSATLLDGPACRAASPPTYCGKVLVAGGFSVDSAASLTSAELFDPHVSTTAGGVATRGAWTVTGSMRQGREGQAAVLLDGPSCHQSAPPRYCGEVLVAGGSAYGGSFPKYFLSSAELYDPASGTWADAAGLDSCASSPAASPASCQARYQASAVALAGGAVLVAGGVGSDNVASPTAEVYDPAFATWRATGSMAAPHPGGALVALAAAALVSGGGTPVSATAEVYDPSVGNGVGGWSPTSWMNVARSGHAAAVLSSGRVLVAGGQDNTSVLLSSAELYDPSPTRTRPTVTAVDPASGPVSGGTSVTVSGSALYSPTTQVWFGTTPAASVVIRADTELVAVAPPLKGVAPVTVDITVATPAGTSAISAVDNFTYAQGSWGPAADLTSCTPTSADCVGRSNHASILLDGPPCHALPVSILHPPTYCGQVLVMGGTDPQIFHDGATTTGSTTFTSASANFSPSDVGFAIEGPPKPLPPQLQPISDDTVIAAWIDPSTVTLSRPAAATAANINFTTRGGTAQLYDPATNTWRPTGRMLAAPGANNFGNNGQFTAGFTATALEDGRVLVAGGCCGPIERIGNVAGYQPNALASAEIYDPAAGTWTATASMNTARYGHTATLLDGAACRVTPRPTWCGQVLVTGGAGDTDLFEVWDSAELYDPLHGTWSTVAPMGSARHGDTAAWLDDNGGEVLVVDGVGHTEPGTGCGTTSPDSACHETPLATAELYSLKDGTWRRTAKDPQAARVVPTATVIAGPGCSPRCGQVLVAGGAPGVAVAEVYDPVTDSWSATGPMAHDRMNNTATLLTSGMVLVSGGLGAGPKLYPLVGVGPTAETYDPSTNGWTPTPPMTADRHVHTATLLDGPACRNGPSASWCGHVLFTVCFPPPILLFNETASTEIYTPAPFVPPQPPPGATGSGSCPAVASPGAGQVAYPSGYSLVGLPQGTVIPSNSPLYSWVDQGASGAYRTDDASTPLVAGRGFWAWFACPKLIGPLPAGTASADLPLGAYHASMVGNPSGQQAVVVTGFDYAVSWDPTVNGGAGGYQLAPYRQPQTVPVGQGIWVFSYTDTTIHIRPATP